MEAIDEKYCKEEDLQPILFGGFTFDPQNEIKGNGLPFHRAFAVATFQLVIRHDKAFVSIHYITEKENNAHIFEQLRHERDHLIHAAQVKEVKTYKTCYDKS